MKRRTFLDQSSLGVTSLLIAPHILGCAPKSETQAVIGKSTPYVISTWNVAQANTIAGKALEEGANALDAAVAGVAFEEANIQNTTVGKGGAPDRDGNVTLDACVMNHLGDCGAVLAVENITHVAALAKDVMEQTPHVILAGAGARKFALEQDYTPEELLTHSSKKAWEKAQSADEEKDFKPHMMYDKKTGKPIKAETYKQHLELKEKGFTHEKPK